MTRAICIIPARMGSTRFPGKVLARETGRPLIQHVYEQASKATLVERVIVATDEPEVREAVRAFGGESVMTSADHPNGTSRLHEASDQLGLEDGRIIVNVQGDEPELAPTVVDRTIEALESTGADAATCAYPFPEDEDPSDPALVKVVRGVDGRALYFSRARIPFVRDLDKGGGAPPGAPTGAESLHHIGIYAYRRLFLRTYVLLEPTPLERAESLEQLRILEHGYSIAVALCKSSEAGGGGIDTPEQYQAFVARWRARGQVAPTPRGA